MITLTDINTWIKSDVLASIKSVFEDANIVSFHANSNSAIKCAAMHGYTQMFQYLYEKGARINESDQMTSPVRELFCALEAKSSLKKDLKPGCRIVDMGPGL